ncbi:MAG: hypothetical protein ACREV8_07360, partial [Gammaproteobacteria bacterium]
MAADALIRCQERLRALRERELVVEGLGRETVGEGVAESVRPQSAVKLRETGGRRRERRGKGPRRSLCIGERRALALIVVALPVLGSGKLIEGLFGCRRRGEVAVQHARRQYVIVRGEGVHALG